MRVGSLMFAYDYMTDNVVVEIKTISGEVNINSGNAIRLGLYHLTLAQKLDGPDRQHYLLVLGVGEDYRNAPYLGRIQTEAAIMGIDVLVTDSAKEAAKVIASAEKTLP